MTQTMTQPSDAQLQDSLDAITSGLQRGEPVDAALEQSGAARSDVEDFAEIILSLQATLTPQEPRRDFARQLRHDLLDDGRGVVSRVRQMPPRVHLAALLAVVAGCAIFVWRRLFGTDSGGDIQEEAIATSA